MMLADPKLPEFVVDLLARGQDRNEVITRLCERTGCMWPEAEAFVKSIEAEESPLIARRQTPTLLLIIVPTFLAGLALLASGSYIVILDAQMLDREFGNALPIGLLALVAQHWQTALMILTGMAMIAGSSLGLAQIVSPTDTR
jgi:hypothetical protein